MMFKSCDHGHPVRAWRVAKNFRAKRRMPSNGLPFRFFESRRFPKDVDGYRALSDIVKHPGKNDFSEKGYGELENQAESEPDNGDIHGMVQRVFVIRLDAGKAKNQSRSQEYFIH